MKPVFLAGVKHCGKTTLGRLLAGILGADFIDIDGVIAEQNGMPAREVFLTKGEGGFIDAELGAFQTVCGTLAAENRAAVIATGGGLCVNERAVASVRKTGHIVYLDVPEETLFERIFSKAERAPDGTFNNLPVYIAAGSPRSKADAARLFHQVFQHRAAQYMRIADSVFAPQNIPAEQNARKLAEALGAGGGAGTQRRGESYSLRLCGLSKRDCR